ncbi:4-amino-4-deoxychorismate lyase [Nakamurella sp. YIM 132087]|uniref:4-amino-4-deoxychorismate lyase n=1 Tax=Nakamurella alba TaxID=2665158 RepID=A0A7K1FRW6_9ACTN|nr:aminotransferase class IV [Nakamurella alba]MTD16099.1 4-amino-4-deoxychorismate lyase [Nakamurella alba]
MASDLLVALLDGTLVPADRPLLRADDAGVTRGDGCFETTLAVAGVPRDLPEHLARLQLSADLLDLVLPGPEDWTRGVDAVLGARQGADQVVRLIATRGPEGGIPTCYVTGGPVPASSVAQRTAGIRVALLERAVSGADAARMPWLLFGAKTLSYAMNMGALRWAAARGLDDVLFVGSDGAVLEGPRSSVVALLEDDTGPVLCTPPADGILDGITVRRLLGAADAAGLATSRRLLTVADLQAAQGVWLTSSVRLLAPVTELDGSPLVDGGWTPRLAALLEVPA